MNGHVAQCPLQRNASVPNRVSECKVCKLWQALHRTRSGGGTGTGSRAGCGHAMGVHIQPTLPLNDRSLHRPGLHPTYRQSNVPIARQTGHSGPKHNEAVRQKLRQLDPAQVISHRQCLPAPARAACTPTPVRKLTRATASIRHEQPYRRDTLPGEENASTTRSFLSEQTMPYMCVPFSASCHPHPPYHHQVLERGRTHDASQS